MDNQLPKHLIIGLALIQGVVLTLLYRSVEHQMWPSTEPVWLTALATFAISFPLMTFMSITQENTTRLIKYLVAFCLILTLLGGYVGLQQEPIDKVSNFGMVATFIFTAHIAAFKGLMYVQQRLSNVPFTYGALFKFSWQNFIIFAQCWLFVLIFWGILNLGAGLFAVLEINFFKELLTKDWFIIPVLNLAFGFAIIVFRNIVHTADNIATILKTLIKFLLPALTIVSLGFLVTLPFTGLESLWKTGSGSLLVMWLQALTLFFVNAVYQDEEKSHPYHHIVHRLIYLGVALLPIYSVIAFYGIWLRVDQYGLTVDRCWAMLVNFLLACFSFGYAFAIIKKRDAWLAMSGKVNVAMGLVVLAVMLLVNSPIINFQALTVKSQLARLHSGELTYENFDYQYFDYALGRQGYLALEELKQELATDHPDIIAKIDRMYINIDPDKEPSHTVDTFEKLVTYWPEKQLFPEGLLNAVYKAETKSRWAQFEKNNYYFIAVDLNDDANNEYVVITENNHSTSGDMWRFDEDEWKSSYMPVHNPDDIRYLKSLLETQPVEVIEPKWKNVQIGSLVFKAPID